MFAGARWMGRRRQARREREAALAARQARFDRAALEHRVGCAILTLVEAGTPVSDAQVIDLMELSGADLPTVFAVLDRVRVDLSEM